LRRFFAFRRLGNIVRTVDSEGQRQSITSAHTTITTMSIPLRWLSALV
jgi:hypothetical protein